MKKGHIVYEFDELKVLWLVDNACSVADVLYSTSCDEAPGPRNRPLWKSYLYLLSLWSLKMEIHASLSFVQVEYCSVSLGNVG
jgi:hypothetical protein